MSAQACSGFIIYFVGGTVFGATLKTAFTFFLDPGSKRAVAHSREMTQGWAVSSAGTRSPACSLPAVILCLISSVRSVH